MPSNASPRDPLELAAAKAEYAGALRELDDLRGALRKTGTTDALLRTKVEEARERVARAAARLTNLRIGRP
jgi:hypothetical protein